MSDRFIGLKIRNLRREKGLTQNELARRAGISASYLNLIESNKRAAAGVLLQRISVALGVEAAQLDGSAERRLAVMLEELAAQPAIAGPKGPPSGAEEIVAHYPEWADLMLRLHRAYHDQAQAVQALADRLNRDPFLGESVHRMLTHVTAISSAAEILRDGEDLTAADRSRFLSIITADSHRMSVVAQSLIGFFDSAQIRIRSATPMEHVDSFIFQMNNHFPVLEDMAEKFRSPFPSEAAFAEAAAHVAEEESPLYGGMPTASARFATARKVAHRLANGVIREIVGENPALAIEESKEIATGALTNYMAAALLMPYDRFLEAAEAHRYDVDILARLFGVSYEQACHRLATLRRPGAEGVAFAFMRSDPSGYVTKRLPLPGLPLPRYGTACPLWPVYGAFQTPGVTVREFGQLPGGDRFLFFARAVEKAPARAGHPRRLMSIMLACQASEADRIACADGIDPVRATVPVGTVCRLCPRVACSYRQEAPLIAKQN